jgi:short-chain fatty acids transporter
MNPKHKRGRGMNNTEDVKKSISGSIIDKTAIVLTNWTTKCVPDSWLIAIYLTVIAAIMTMVFCGNTPLQVIKFWGDGFWTLLSFSMQMTLILFCGYILANAPPINNILVSIASIPKTPRQAVLLVAFASMFLALLNWSLSIVGSIILIRVLARRNLGTDYRLMVAAGYLGMGCTWHAGFSASAPLLVATPGHFMEKMIGVIPVSGTILNMSNILMVIIVIIVMSALVVLMHPSKKDTVEIDPLTLQELQEFVPPVAPAQKTISQKQEFTRMLNILVGGIGIIWLALYFYKSGFTLTLNVVIFALLFLGILLHPTPASVLKASDEAGKLTWGIILQYPFYAGIFGIITYSDLGLVIAKWLISISNKETFPLVVYWYSGILNYFIPSGGSKWAIEGVYLMEAAKTLGVSVNHTIMAYAWGDMATDIIQPLWCVPILSAAKMEFKSIMGFCLIMFAVFAVITSIGFYFLPF